MIARASHLPDVSVEQMFLSGESYPDGKSRYFTIRTTEKQPELVRASLDRLFRDKDGNSLMAGAVMTYPNRARPRPARGRNCLSPRSLSSGPRQAPSVSITLDFSRPTSRAYVQELIEREYRTERLRQTEPLGLTPARRPSRWPLHEDAPWTSRRMRHSPSLPPPSPRTRPDKIVKWRLWPRCSTPPSGRSMPRPNPSGWKRSTASSPSETRNKASVRDPR